jgi:phosphoribosylcarboxyaminoimidazole (NCAIR) mutase
MDNKSDKEKLAEQLYDLGYNYVSGYMSWNHHKEKTIETYVKDYTKEELQCIILSLL